MASLRRQRKEQRRQQKQAVDAEGRAEPVAAPAAGAASAAGGAGAGLSAEECRYVKGRLVALLTAADLSDEAMWTPLAMTLRFDDDEVEQIRLARRTTLACCAALLSDPTAISATHPNLHALLRSRPPPLSPAAPRHRTRAAAESVRERLVARQQVEDAPRPAATRRTSAQGVGMAAAAGGTPAAASLACRARPARRRRPRGALVLM